jgi:hypothetical protein
MFSSKVSTFDNSTLKNFYPNLSFLFDFLQPYLDVNVELIREEDEEEYRKLLKTTVINADTTGKFPLIKEEHQEPMPEKDTCLDYVSIISIYEDYPFSLFFI